MKNLKLKMSDTMMFINDVHISDRKIHDFNVNMDEALRICKEKNISYLVVGGDLFEARASQPLNVLISVKKFLEKATNNGLMVILANGNHDKVAQEEDEGYCHIFNTIDNVIVIDDWMTIDTPHANIYVLAYFPETGSLSQKLEDIQRQECFANGKKNVLYAHAGVLDALGTENKNEISPKHFIKFDNVYMGHYHNRNKFGKNIEYIGSSRQFNYGEDEYKGYNICNSFGELEFIQNKANVRYTTLEVAYKDIDSIPDIIEEFLQDKTSEYRIRIIVKATEKTRKLVDINKIQKMGVDKVIVDYNTTTQTSNSTTLYKKLTGEQIKIAYQEYCKESKANPELGVKYIDDVNIKYN